MCETYALNPNYMRVTGSDWSSRPDKSFFIPRSTRSKYRTCNEAPAETTNGFIVARKTSDPYPKLCATLRVLSLRHHHPPIIIIAVVIAIASFIQHLTLLCRVSPHLIIIAAVLSTNSSPATTTDDHQHHHHHKMHICPRREPYTRC